MPSLSVEEICLEHKPQGISHVKRLIMKTNDQLIQLNAYLLTFDTPSIPISIHNDLYNVKVHIYIPNCTTDPLFQRGNNLPMEQNNDEAMTSV